MSVQSGLAFCLLLLPTIATAELPRLRDLLPETTLAYVEASDYSQLLAHGKKTVLGRIAEDPELAKFVVGAGQSLLDYQFPASRLAREEGDADVASAWRSLGTSDLGQVVVAFVAAGKEYIPLVMIEPRGAVDLVDKLARDQLAALVRGGGEQHNEKIPRGELQIVVSPTSGDPLGALLVRDGVYAICERPAPLFQIAAAWDGKTKGRLAKNDRFSRWQKELENDKTETKPDLEFFVDVAAVLAKFQAPEAKLAPRTRHVETIWEGVEAIVGDVRLGQPPYDLLANIDLRLETPRVGLAKLLTLDPGSTRAEDWMPREACTYTTLRWSVPRAQQEYAKLQQASDRDRLDVLLTELDFDERRPAEFAEVLSDRFSHCAWFAPEGSLSQLWSLRLQTGTALQKALGKHSDQWQLGERRKHGGIDYVVAPAGSRLGCAAVLDDHLLMASDAAAIQRAIDVWQRPEDRLNEQLDYRYLDTTSQRLADNRGVATQFARPTEIVRRLWQQLQGFDNSKRDQELLVKVLSRALENSSLPDVSRVEKHFAPSGGILTTKSAGLRYTFFVLIRR